ncbi:MAG: phospholipase D-like domain-containing protein [Candidatus Nanohaloarchaea archaeon]
MSFVGQGLEETETTVGDLLTDYLTKPKFKELTWFIGFAKAPGVEGLKEYIEESKDYYEDYNIFVGLDHQGTPKRALEGLLDWGINVQVYYTPSPITFHPKVYLFEGDKEVRIIIGSSNLSKEGLFENIESSILVKFSRPDEEGEKLLKEIKNYFESFLENNDENVHNLTEDLLEYLINQGIVPETAESSFTENSNDEKSEEFEEGRFSPIDIQRAPPSFSSLGSNSQNSEETLTEESGTQKETGVKEKRNLLWRKKNLPSSDVLDEEGVSENTNITGELRFTQARFEVNNERIDQTTYFREDAFGDLEWEEDPETGKEETEIECHIRLNDDDIGTHTLEVVHDPELESGQRNFTTSLRWGDISDEIRSHDLTGKNFYIYDSAEADDKFVIEIREDEVSSKSLSEF